MLSIPPAFALSQDQTLRFIIHTQTAKAIRQDQPIQSQSFRSTSHARNHPRSPPKDHAPKAPRHIATRQPSSHQAAPTTHPDTTTHTIPKHQSQPAPQHHGHATKPKSRSETYTHHCTTDATVKQHNPGSQPTKPSQVQQTRPDQPHHVMARNSSNNAPTNPFPGQSRPRHHRHHQLSATSVTTSPPVNGDLAGSGGPVKRLFYAKNAWLYAELLRFRVIDEQGIGGRLQWRPLPPGPCPAAPGMRCPRPATVRRPQ